MYHKGSSKSLSKGVSWAKAKAIAASAQYVYVAFEDGIFTNFTQVDITTGKSIPFYKVGLVVVAMLVGAGSCGDSTWCASQKWTGKVGAMGVYKNKPIIMDSDDGGIYLIKKRMLRSLLLLALTLGLQEPWPD
jgi:hypothetical protein